MTNLSRDILENWQVRKTRKQKTAFIEYLCSRFPEATVEEGGRSRNIVIGDVAQAELVLTAHYDTCAVLPFPNFILPQSVVLSLLYGVLIAVPILAIGGAALFLTEKVTHSLVLSELAYFLVMAFLLGWMFLGKPNRHTVNDNTSGVITLVELLQQLTEEQRQRVAFVFFDNEENGLLGSSQFKKRHKEIMRDKLLLNFDCVSDGDTIALVCPKKLGDERIERLRKAFAQTGEKRLLVGFAGKMFYPSDQSHFPCGVGVAALKGKKLLYLDRIHTKQDTVFDEANIHCLCQSVDRWLKTQE